MVIAGDNAQTAHTLCKLAGEVLSIGRRVVQSGVLAPLQPCRAAAALAALCRVSGPAANNGMHDS